MSRHINLFGYSLWTLDEAQESNERASSSQVFYSPTAIAAYCIFSSFFVGIILYGVNVLRRGYLWQGRTLIALSGLLLTANALISAFNPLISTSSSFLLNGLVAISLYAAENPHFQRLIRNGRKPARWWPPLIWIGIFWGVLIVVQMVIG